MSYRDAVAQGDARDRARAAGVVSVEVRRRKAAEASRDYWKALALALLKWPMWR